MQTCKGRCRFI